MVWPQRQQRAAEASDRDQGATTGQQRIIEDREEAREPGERPGGERGQDSK